ncbi:MAG: CDP-alcohol phosphatidyltransferase family protein [Dehalococcoidia bacterium]|nr:CDP-alcohol phosphatidyltransferase family protein [Dehalococcoidia bacterium]
MHRLRNLLSPIVDGIARVLVKLGFSPSGLTVIGVLIACVAAALISQGMLTIGGIVMLIAGVFDMFDGAVARMTDRATKFGAFFDSVMDRVSEAVVLLGLLWFYLDDGEQLGAVLVYVAIVGSTMVSYARARAEGLSIECKGGLMQRPERVASLGVGITVGQWWEPAVLIVLGVIAALTVVTTVQRVVETARGAGE